MRLCADDIVKVLKAARDAGVVKIKMPGLDADFSSLPATAENSPITLVPPIPAPDFVPEPPRQESFDDRLARLLIENPAERERLLLAEYDEVNG